MVRLRARNQARLAVIAQKRAELAEETATVRYEETRLDAAVAHGAETLGALDGAEIRVDMLNRSLRQLVQLSTRRPPRQILVIISKMMPVNRLATSAQDEARVTRLSGQL